MSSTSTNHQGNFKPVRTSIASRMLRYILMFLLPNRNGAARDQRQGMTYEQQFAPHDNMPQDDEAWWAETAERIEREAIVDFERANREVNDYYNETIRVAKGKADDE